MDFVPKQLFFTKGRGIHRDKLISFELALRDAGIQMCNWVPVSSVYPPNIKVIDRYEGQDILKPGQVVFCVMARESSNEEGKDIYASVGWARPDYENLYGYMSEYHGCNELGRFTPKVLGEEAEMSAIEMLKTFHNSITRRYESGHIIETARVPSGLYCTVLAAAVLLL